MANEEKIPPNITQHYNLANVGLNMDRLPSQLEKGKLTYSLNAVVENFDASGVTYQNELGNELCLNFPEGFVLIGHHFISEREKHIFFITNPATGDCQIGYMINNDCVYRTLVDDPCLGWNIQYPIHKIVHRITNCTEEIYWPDNVARRFLDLNNVPYLIQDGTTLCDPVYTNRVDCNQLRLQPNFEIPLLSIIDVINGGDLLSGVYQFAIQYSDAVGNPYTSYYSITNPVPIADVNTVTSNFNYKVGKSIIVNIENLDVSGQFQYFNLAVIKTINAISSVELIGVYYIDNASQQLIYTGQSKTDIRLSIDDIFEKFPYYDIADDITTAQDVLIWKGLSSIERINYQEIASKVHLQWETYRIPPTENYADELNAANLRGYMRDEVYAFEICFLLANGKQTDGFHIPGRECVVNDPSTVGDVFPLQNPVTPDYIETRIVSERFRIYNTAYKLSDSPEKIANANYKGPWEYGEFAYWESEEEYPCNATIWGDLVGQKIRHHKFPDVAICPIFESGNEYSESDSDPLSSMTMGNRATFALGVKVDANSIKALIEQSSLTEEQKRDIVGFKILRGNRSGNSSIVAKGILRNVNKYTREGNDYYFVNYPYNDLHEDVFLYDKNGAYIEDSNCYNVNVTELGVGSIAVIEYTDVYTNRITYKQLDRTGWFVQICALNNPRFISGEGSTATCKYNEFGIGVTQLAFGAIYGATKIRLHYSYVSYTEGLVSRISDWVTEGQVCEPSSAYCYFVNVKVVATTDVLVYKIERLDISSGVITELSPPLYYAWVLIQENISYSCSEGYHPLSTYLPKPLQSPMEISEAKSFHIFNSPETAFGQPILGNILKLEGKIFGKGVAHFQEVLKNAKYKLLTAKAQRDFLEQANDVANGMDIAGSADTFDMQGFLSAYDSLLTINLNTISGRNFATAFHSIASYDYYLPTNTVGQIQRLLQSKKYLTPNVISVDDIIINNWQRETSVFLKTESIPFDYPTITNFEDESRFTMGDKKMYTDPFGNRDISVLSYYASLKNIFNNQWGQIYSYETIDTGYQCLFDVNVDDRNIFGGDTFICRFAFKTKLPFFTENRVNAPDNSDVYYDEIGNVAYPKYWHSSRSKHEDFVVGGGPNLEENTLPNFISYKAHYFDLPNVQVNNPPGDVNTLIYAGYFYLFAYGIPNFYCETSYNLDLRQSFNNKEGDFWPHVSSNIPDEWLQEYNVSIAYDNTYHYNTSYSKQNKENTFSHLPPDWEDKECYSIYPFRAVYSDLQNTDADNRVNAWRAYRAVSYFDFPQNYGGLTSVDGIQNSAILTRFENKTLMYNKLLTIDTNNPKAAYIGNPSLFKGSPPIDFAETDLGYIGSQHKMLLKVPQGQISVDAKRGQVFLITGMQATDLSQFGSGVNRFFTEHLPFEIIKYFPDVNIDNHYNGIGLHGVYDSNYDRVIITKLDYLPLRDDIQYGDGEFYIETPINTVVYDCHFEAEAGYFSSTTTTTTTNVSSTTTTSTTRIPGTTVTTLVKTVVELNDSEYFCNRSWTISFNLSTNNWISFHSYIPNYYIAENNFFYSGINDCCSEFDFIAATLVPSTTTTTTTRLTTTTTSTTSTTTTSTSTSSTTSTTTTTEYVCQRPPNLNAFILYMGYYIGGVPFISTESAEDACMAMNVIFADDNFYPVVQGVEATNLSIGSTVYEGIGETDCTCMSDGWYFTAESAQVNKVFRIENCEVVEDYSCISTTTTSTTSSTTTTTTTSPPSPINCDSEIFYSGRSIYPSMYTVDTSSATGTVVFSYSSSLSAPNRFIVKWDGGIVIDTGFVGSDNYNLGGLNRDAFNASLSGYIDPVTSNVYPDVITYPDDGYPLISNTVGYGSDWFDKSSASPSEVYIEVYSSMTVTHFECKVDCPGTTTTTTSSTTSTTSSTTTSTTSSTTTTTTTIIVLESDVLVNSGHTPTQIYSYNPPTNVSSQLSIPNITASSSDVAHTANKMWLPIGNYLREWDITLSPFSATYSRDILVPYSSAGLCAIDDTHLILIGGPSNGVKKAYEIDVSGSTVVTTEKVTLIGTRVVSGDYFLTTDRKLIVSTELGGLKYISQYDYDNNWLEVDIQLDNPPINAPWGLFEYDSEIYILNPHSYPDSSKVYKIDSVSPYTITEVVTMSPYIHGASQIPPYLTVSFNATKAPVSGDVYTYLVSTAEFDTYEDACLDDGHYDAIYSGHPIENMLDEQFYDSPFLDSAFTGSGIRWVIYRGFKYSIEFNNGVLVDGIWC